MIEVFLPFAKKNLRLIVVALVAMAILIGLKVFGDARYDAGVADEKAEFEKVDQEKAGELNEAVDDAFDNLDPNATSDELLRSTGGLRDDPNNP